VTQIFGKTGINARSGRLRRRAAAEAIVDLNKFALVWPYAPRLGERMPGGAIRREREMRMTTRSVARSVLVAILTVLAALILGVTQTLTTAVTAAVGLAATRALIVPGTGTPNPAPVLNYMENARDYYIIPGGDCPDVAGCQLVPVEYIAQFWPFPFEGWGGLEGAKWNVSVASGVDSVNTALGPDPDASPVVIFGYSQGATVTSIVKSQLAAQYPDGIPSNIQFFVIGNPNRADGGLFERLALLGTPPILDATFGNPTITNSSNQVNTIDLALTYDGVVDSPSWVLNGLALANAAAGFAYTHPTYLHPNGTITTGPYGYTPAQLEAAVATATAPGGCTEDNFCQRHGDTMYITLPAKTLPIMQPFLDLAQATGTSALVIPIVDLISPAAQTLIETGYTRTNYSVPTPFQLVPRFNPVQVAADLVNDIPEGINAAANPGLDPLPGWRDPLANVQADVEAVRAPEPTVESDNKPLTRLSMIARPNQGITLPDDTTAKPERTSLRGALGDSRPIRDTVRAVAGAVKKALGQDDDTDAADSDASSEPGP
jgi:PE-PPE domain